MVAAQRLNGDKPLMHVVIWGVSFLIFFLVIAFLFGVSAVTVVATLVLATLVTIINGFRFLRWKWTQAQ